MRSITLFLASICAIAAISCQKDKQNTLTGPVTSHETVKVRLKLTGDILNTDSPLPNGRKAGDDAHAKDFGNNTLYSVCLREQGAYQPLSTGLFSHPDSMYIDMPVSGQYNVAVGIYKKGTGNGLWYDPEDGLPYFGYPVFTSLKNRMDSVTGFPHMLDSVAGLYTVNPLNSEYPLNAWYPEVEYFHGDTNFVGAANPAPISINLKRNSFGIQLSATNFTSGKLMAEFSWINWNYEWSKRLTPITVTPADINSQYHIFGADEFRTSDSTYGIYVRLSRIQPDNSSFILGEQQVYFKRNVLTKLHVNLSSGGRTSAAPQRTETDRAGNTIIHF